MRDMIIGLALAVAGAGQASGQWGASGCGRPLPVRQPSTDASAASTSNAPACCVKVLAVEPGAASIRCGSGTVLKRPPGESDRVLTARHVVLGAGAVRVVCGGKVLPATVVAVSKDADLALLGVGEALSYTVLADAEPAVGEPVETWGFGGGGGCRPTVGVATGPETAVAPTQPGDSGAGVFDKAGRLVGVHVAGDSAFGPGRLGVRIPLTVVKKFLAEAMPEPKVACPCPAGGCACHPCQCGPGGGESCPCGGKCRPCEVAPPPRKVRQQYPPGGVARNKFIGEGRNRYILSGREVEPPEALAAIEAGGSGGDLTDDSTYPFLTVVGSEADRDRILKDARDTLVLSSLKLRWKAFPPGHKMVADFPAGLLHLQAPNGRPLGSLAAYDGPEKLAEWVKTRMAVYDPSKDPGPGKPYPWPKPAPPKTPDAPVQPKPPKKPGDDADPPDRPDCPCGPAGCPTWVKVAGAFVAALLLFLFRKRGA